MACEGPGKHRAVRNVNLVSDSNANAGPTTGSGPIAGTATAPAPVPAPVPALWQLSLRGELDVESAPRVRAELAAAIESGATAVMVDLRNVTFLDSSGLSALVECGQALSARGGSLYLEGASGAVRQVLEITALLDHYRHHGGDATDRSAD